MTLATEMTNDLLCLFNAAEFAVGATYRHGNAIKTIPVIFDNASSGQLMMDSRAEEYYPQAMCRAFDIEDDCNGDALIIGAVTYYIREYRASEDGRVATLILSKV